MAEKKRVILLTDSLGCPRKETSVEITWTDRVLRSFSGCYFYSCCIHGLYAKMVPIEYIHELQPDLIIIQMGVVDACRRAMPDILEKIVRHIPLLSNLVRYVCRKFHFGITRLFNIHYTSVENFYSLFVNVLEHSETDICFITIAPASFVMKSKVYNFEQDVKEYNKVFLKLQNKYGKRIHIINPYENSDPDELFIGDGHHLNEKAHDIVFSSVSNYLSSFLGG